MANTEQLDVSDTTENSIYTMDWPDLTACIGSRDSDTYTTPRSNSCNTEILHSSGL